MKIYQQSDNLGPNLRVILEMIKNMARASIILPMEMNCMECLKMI